MVVNIGRPDLAAVCFSSNHRVISMSFCSANRSIASFWASSDTPHPASGLRRAHSQNMISYVFRIIVRLYQILVQSRIGVVFPIGPRPCAVAHHTLILSFAQRQVLLKLWWYVVGVFVHAAIVAMSCRSERRHDACHCSKMQSCIDVLIC